MLSQGNKGIIFLMVILICSCNESGRRLDYFKIRTSSFESLGEQKRVYKLVTDTINSWISLNLKYFYFLDGVRNTWKIDDCIFFNSQLTKCVINMPIMGDTFEGASDSITILLGEKINDQWWFYDGPQYAVLREPYSKDTKKPLSLAFLTERARANALSWYYIEKPTGTCLKKFFSEGYASYKKCSDEKYIINDAYFENEFNYRPSFELRQKDYRERFLKDRFQIDSAKINQ